jgi:hypothetical protein
MRHHYAQFYYYQMYGVAGYAESYPNRPDVKRAVKEDEKSGFKAIARKHGW